MLTVFLALSAVALAQGPGGNTVQCFDAVATCTQLKALGYCGTNALVRQKCPVSCGTCPTPNPTPAPVAAPAPGGGGTPSPVPPPGPVPAGCDPQKPSCCDSVTTCANFQAAGACQSRAKQVGQICPYTCGMCTQTTIACSKSALDCYTQQMGCANTLRNAGTPITSSNLINCVLPLAQALPPSHCCHQFAEFQYHCHDKSPSDYCECNNYDDYWTWINNGSPTHSDGTGVCMGTNTAATTFSVQENFFQNEKACAKGEGSKLVNSYTYSWKLDACNDVLSGGSVEVACAPSTPGSLEVTEYGRAGCKGKQGKTHIVAPGACRKHKKEARKYNFYAQACGNPPSPMPTAAPIAQSAFASLGDWQKLCKTKRSKKTCQGCGGKFKKGQCRLNAKTSKKVKCKKLNDEVCGAIGCTVDRSGKKPRCTGSPNFPWAG